MAGGALFVLVATIAGCGTFMNSRQQALDKATAAVRAAAEQARVELADAPCPTNPTSRPPDFGSIDKIVTLS